MNFLSLKLQKTQAMISQALKIRKRQGRERSIELINQQKKYLCNYQDIKKPRCKPMNGMQHGLINCSEKLISVKLVVKINEQLE